MQKAIHWFRRDLRLTDNTAFLEACREADEVVTVYIVSDWQGGHRWTGSPRQEFLCQSLAVLDEKLRQRGGRLIVRQGEAGEELAKLVHETGAEAVFFNCDPDPYGREVEKKLKKLGVRERFAVRGCLDACMHERGEVLTEAGGPYRVFTPYSRAWQKLAKRKPDGSRPSLIDLGLPSGRLPSLTTWELPEVSGNILEGGEEAASARFARFLKSGIGEYGERRDLLAGEATSRLSQDLRFGLLSIREVFHRCEAHKNGRTAKEVRNVDSFVRQLIWREFYMDVLWHFPEMLEVEFNPQYRHMHWPGRGKDFERWCRAETGFPIVDAAMSELLQTGYMHNRARLIVAMFLTKDLHLDWRLGERFFMQHLVDGEIANNNGGWQWAAGTGADAAPYFRIQNPWTQTARYDPEGKYIKRWLPELKNVPARNLAQPPPEGESLVAGYPMPMVDHAKARETALELFSQYAKS